VVVAAGVAIAAAVVVVAGALMYAVTGRVPLGGSSGPWCTGDGCPAQARVGDRTYVVTCVDDVGTPPVGERLDAEHHAPGGPTIATDAWTVPGVDPADLLVVRAPGDRFVPCPGATLAHAPDLTPDDAARLAIAPPG
jgi:hypothetical protein